jgi:hypothetical protein
MIRNRPGSLWISLRRPCESSGLFSRLWLLIDFAQGSALTLTLTPRIDIILDSRPGPPLIYHVVHSIPLDWSTVLDGLANAGLSFKRVNPAEWLKKVEGSSDDAEVNPSKQMLGMWSAAVSALSRLMRHPQTSMMDMATDDHMAKRNTS